MENNDRDNAVARVDAAGHEMEKSHSASYAAAGVDITAGYQAVQRMRRHVQRTLTPGVLGGLGGFGGAFAPDVSGMEQPVLVSGTDGVGTKLRLAVAMDKHDTIGIDCVAMCVNDILCAGAKPLFFLDYIACGKNVPEKIEAIVAGVAEGCVQAGCALIGGETAEHPGVMSDEDYDLAGFAVGLADRADLLDNSQTTAGDVLIALPSSGVHSNGFSLVRKVFGTDADPAVLHAYEDRLGRPLGEVLLAPTRIYAKAVAALLGWDRRECGAASLRQNAQLAPAPLGAVRVRGLSHITGGGFFENIPRCLPEGFTAEIDQNALRVPPVFNLIAELGGIPQRDMFNTFNMGVGMVAVVAAEDRDAALAALRAAGEDAWQLGRVAKGGEGVVFL